MKRRPSIDKKQTFLNIVLNCHFFVLHPVAILIIYSGITYASNNFNLIQIRCDGTIQKITSQSDQAEIKKQGFIGHVQRGLCYENEFYAVGLKNELIKTNIITGGSIKLFDFNDINFEYKLWRILYVNDKKIIISAYLFDDNNQSIANQYNYRLFQINRKTLNYGMISIPNCRNDYVTYYNETCYYSDNNGDIYRYIGEEKNKKLGIKGRYPTISPDGAKIAYIKYGTIWTKVCIFELSSEKKRIILKFLGKNSVYPLLSWSKNGKLLAVSNNSDFFSKVIYIVDTESGEKIKKIKKSYACYWFFE